MKEEKLIGFRYEGKDDWGRPTYKSIQTGKLFKIVDGKVFSTTAKGEPLSPVKQKKTKKEDVF